MAGQFLTQVLIEFAEEDLSDVTPTWNDVTADCQGIEWWAGIDSEGDDPQPGGATIRMRSDKKNGRRWEPDYVAGQFYPNITAHRRFRLTLDDAAGAAVQEGLWYITDIAIEYPAGTGYSEVVFTCADGFEVLALDDLPQLDPPDANSYADVVAYDEPWGYWQLGEPDGTQATARFRKKFKGKGKNRRKVKRRVGTRYTTREEASGVAGPSGIYKNTPALGQPGLILGESDTAVKFTAADSEYAQAAVDADSFQVVNSFTTEVWVKPTTTSIGSFLLGPRDTGGGTTGPIFSLAIGAGPTYSASFLIDDTISALSSTTAAVIDTTAHVVATWDGGTARLYVDGVEEDSLSRAGRLDVPDTDLFVFMGGNPAVNFANVTLDEVAVYEHALTADRVMSHYVAGSARGFDQQTAGERIASIASHALWSEASIQTSGRDVQPVMMAGQSRLEEIAELAHAEGQRTMFFFNGSGDPVYLGHEWQASSATYNTTQVTLGDQSGEVAYEALEPVYDNEVYNEVTVSHESGLAATVGTGTPPPRRANTDYTDVLLMEHVHVESLANALLAFYEDPQFRFETVTLNGSSGDRLNHILRRDIGHQVRVKKSGETGARIDRISNIIGKRKQLTKDKHLNCTWNLSRGLNASDGFWHAGVVGFSEAGATTVAA